MPSGVCALIPAAGRGARFGGPANKVFAPLLGRPLLGWTLQAFAHCADIDAIVLIGSAGERDTLREIGERYGGGKFREVVAGGANRQESVRNGLAACGDAEIVAIHDAARPCITPAQITATIDAARASGAALLAVPVADTLLRGATGETVDRTDLYAVQTPQTFHTSLIRDAHEAAARDGFAGTDDAGLVRLMGHPVTIVPGSPQNLKVTRAEDLALVAVLLAPAPNPSPASRERGAHSHSQDRSATGQGSSSGSPLPRSGGGVGGGGIPPLRIGHGYDVHPFADAAEKRTLYLGGVPFPDAPRGMKAHSDGDVLLHALCDALLGAAGLGDIGKLFPPSDMRHKDRSSIEFLREVAARLTDDGWRVANVDVTVLAETPKIRPKADAMRAVISVELGISPAQVGIKATTNEGLGSIGRGEGIAVHATALLFGHGG